MAQRSKRCVSDLCEITSSKRIFAADYQAEGVPFFRGKEITEKYNGAIAVSTELFIERSKFEEIKAKSGAPMPGDLLLTSVGTLGSTYVVRPGDEFYFKDGNITWFRDFRGLDSTYFNYWLTAPDGRAELKKCTIGSSQSAYTIILLKGMEIDLPSLPEQRRIASILSAYDDLIENNTRRIAILEEMARRIYEEWFVRFRFPGHEGVRMVKSELGLVPEGWAPCRLERVCSRMNSGNTPSRSNPDYWDGGTVAWYKTKELWDGYLFESEERISEQAVAEKKTRVFEAETILMAIYGSPTVGRLGITTGRCACNQAALGMLPDRTKITFWMLYYTLLALRAEFNNKAQGAAQQNISKEKVAEMPFLLPAMETQLRFDEVVGPMQAMLRNLQERNRNLRTTRELLLPKLISGELDVSAIPEPEALAA
jgi:type I restriction enzyme, S subunit